MTERPGAPVPDTPPALQSGPRPPAGGRPGQGGGSIPDLRGLQESLVGLKPSQAVDALRDDQRRRWDAGRPVPALAYLELIPDLRTDPEAAVDLIWSEYTLREEFGDAPDLEEYVRTFPEYESPLRRQHEVHEWLERAESQEVVENAPTPTGPDLSGPDGRSLFVPGFVVLGQVGRGGMGVVYRARKLSLGCDVALKVLPAAFAADPERRRRFRAEAAIAARLSDARVLPVFDVLESQGTLVLVMPFVEGWDLARVLSDREAHKHGRAPDECHPAVALAEPEFLEFLMPLLDQLVDAVAATHDGGVIHRDLKPSNVLVGRRGDARLTDFGLARLGQGSLLTVAGDRLGTPGFMSPEQWGDDALEVDARADVFGLGATIYQALTSELPYGRRRVGPRAPLPRDPAAGRPWVPAGVSAVVLKALEPDRRDRYASGTEMRVDWRRARDGKPTEARRPGPVRRLSGGLRRRPRTFAGTALSAAVLGFAGLNSFREGPPPPAPAAVTVSLATRPPGARVVFVPVDPGNGEPRPERATRPEGTTPLKVELAPGDYFVEAGVDGYGFHEVFRHVPAPGETLEAGRHARSFPRPDGSSELPEIDIPDAGVTAGMARFDGAEAFVMGSDRLRWVPEHKRSVPAFYMDPAEVTVADYRRVAGALPPQLRDRPPGDSRPVTFVQYGQALDFAEEVGKRLPTEAEYEYAATAGGTAAFPWGDAVEPVTGRPWSFGPVREPAFDKTRTDPPVYGLYSNAAEWTTSWLTPYPGAPPATVPGYQEGRVVRGGPASVVNGAPKPLETAKGPRWRHAYTREQARPGLGFRCVRSARPRFLDLRPPAPGSSALPPTSGNVAPTRREA